jgi:hypothetical protein
MTNYSDGDTVTFVVDPGNPTLKQTFTGTKSGNTVIGTVWTEGNNQPHTAGATIIDYVTATDWELLRMGIGKHANPDGSLITAAVQKALNLANTPAAGWNSLGYNFSYVANNGQKEFQVSTPSDLSNVLTKGMKFQISRPSGTPTQAMSFQQASNQNATIAAPAGISMTNTVSVEAWVYMSNYLSGVQTILRRGDGSTGFSMDVDSNGTVRIFGTTAAGQSRGSFSAATVPLNKWVHIAGVLTISSGTFVAQVYYNGQPQAMTGVGGSSAITSFVEAGALSIGAFYPGGTVNSPFQGQMSEVRLWSTMITQAQIQQNMAISLVGNEPNLVGLWQGNGNFNDKTSNGNNLTATSGAIATYVSNPYNTIEYGYITKISVVSGVTTLTLFMGTQCSLPSTGALSAPGYSIVAAPFGFPTAWNKWIVENTYAGVPAASIGAYNSWQTAPLSGPMGLNIPTGEWDVSFDAVVEQDNTTGGFTAFRVGFYTTAPPNEAGNWVAKIYSATSTTGLAATFHRANPVTTSALTQWQLYILSEAGGGSVSITTTASSASATSFLAKCAYA